MEHASAELQNDQEIVLAMVNNDGDALEFASDELQNDQEIVLAAVSNEGLALQFAWDELKNDREIVLAAANNDGDASEFALDELQNDREIVLATANNNGCAFQFALEELRSNIHFIVSALLRSEWHWMSRDIVDNASANVKEKLRTAVAMCNEPGGLLHALGRDDSATLQAFLSTEAAAEIKCCKFL